MLKRLASFAKVLLRPLVIPLSVNPAAMELNGGIANVGALVTLLSQMANNGHHAFNGMTSYATLSNAAGQTWAVANIPVGIPGTVILRSGAAVVSDTTDTAANILGGMPNAYVGQTFLLVVTNLNSGTLTLVAGSGVTLAGFTTVSTGAVRFYQGKVTNVATPAVLLTGMFSITANAGF